MKNNKWLFIILAITMIAVLMSGCTTAKDEKRILSTELVMRIGDMSLLESEGNNSSEFDMSKINSELTIGEAISVFGTDCSSYRNSMFPISLTWELPDKKQIEILFDRDDKEEFFEKMNNGDFILPEEKVEYDENGIHFATQNEMKMLTEFNKGFKAVKAYYREGKEETIIFQVNND